MNRNQIEGSCKQWVGKLQSQWGKWTDDAELVNAGERTQFAGKIQQQYGTVKQQAELQLQEFRERHRDWNPAARDRG